MTRNLLILLALVFTTSCYSQVDFGIKAGLNFSNAIYNTSDDSPEGRVGGYVGTLVDFKLSPNFSLQPELVYSSEGIKDGSVEFLNLSVALKWYFFDGIYVQAGPQAGMILDAEGGTGGLNTYNLSGFGGIGYQVPGGGFMVDARFTHGITSIIDKDFGIPTGMGYNLVGIKGWMRTFQLGIGYKF